MAEKAVTDIDWKEESQRFDGVADIYDAYRPSYPPELIETVVTLSRVQPDWQVLEIGSGTGKATLLFAQRGLSILGIEPGQNLIDVAAENLKAFPQVRFERARFEDWEAGDAVFDLVFSAQAFHWVPEEVRLVKAAGILKEEGYLTLFWNMYPGIEGAVGHELDQVYEKRAPELGKPTIPSEQLHWRRARSLSEGGFSEDVIVRTFPWSVRYGTIEYLGLLSSYSDHLRLADENRRVLFGEIAEVIERHGGFIEKPYLAALYMARKSGEW